MMCKYYSYCIPSIEKRVLYLRSGEADFTMQHGLNDINNPMKMFQIIEDLYLAFTVCFSSIVEP